MAGVALVAVLASGCAAGDDNDGPDDPTEETAAEGLTPSPVPSPSPSPPAVAPRSEATTAPPTATTVVPLRVERRAGDPATEGFAEQAMSILTDERGWGRAGFRFVVEEDAPYLLVLAEGDEVDRLCEPYETEGRFSCQNGPVVALNADRWREATQDWPGDLASYRTYLVNHEVGHLLHLHHPAPQCPGPGLPAPVMLQQSTELDTCEANPWPLPWEVDLAAARAEPLAPPADHDVEGHQPSPPPQQQDLDHDASDG